MTTTLTRGLLACPPRWGTPRTSRPSLGAQVGKVAAQVGTPLMPWQQHVADVAFEQNPDGSLVYTRVGLQVGRQQGKTALKFVVALHRLVVMCQTHGPQVVTYTMQNRLKARTRLERDYAKRLRGSRGFREIPAKSRVRPAKANEWRLGMNSGTEHIQFGPASYLQIDTPSRTGGHGDTLDLGLIDEAFAHEDDAVELGMEPALLVPADTQLWILSAAGDAKSKYLYREVLVGRELVESGADVGTAYFEWSAGEGDDPSDPDVWAGCLPALGIIHADGSGVTIEKIAARWQAAQRGGQLAIDRYRRSYLCQWPEVPVLDDAVKDAVVDLVDWAGCRDDRHTTQGRVAFGVHVTRDGRSACIAVSDGVHGEITGKPDLLDFRAGTGWVVPRLKELQVAHGGVVALDPKGASGILLEGLETAGVDFEKVSLGDHAHACQGLVDVVTAHTFRHIGQPDLDAAVRGAGRRWVGDVWLWDERASNADPAPLVAVTLARWAAISGNGPSIYEDRGLRVIG